MKNAKKLRSRSEHGATAIEYALIATLVVIAAIPAIQALGGNTNGMYTVIQNKISSAMAR
jgi:pilus assembly protein Flp/PilA